VGLKVDIACPIPLLSGGSPIMYVYPKEEERTYRFIDRIDAKEESFPSLSV